MSDFEDALNKIMSSPEDLEKIMGLAKSLSGSSGGASPDDGTAARDNAEPSGDTPSGDGILGSLPNLDPKMLGMLGRLMGAYGSGGGDKAELIGALRPYLKETQRGRLDRAAEISKLAKLAKIAMSEFTDKY